MSGLAGGLQVIAAQLVMALLAGVHWIWYHDGLTTWRRRRAHLPAPAPTAHAHWWAGQPWWVRQLPGWAWAAWLSAAALLLNPAAAIALLWAGDAAYAAVMIIRRRTAVVPSVHPEEHR